jgi:lysophospholipase L1-like esterase
MQMIQSNPSSRLIRVAALLLLGVACASCSNSTAPATPGSGPGSSTGGTPGGVGTGGNTTAGGATGGSTTPGSGNGASLQQACAAACGTETALACYKDTCQADCIAKADETPGVGTNCRAQFTALTQCESALTGDKWTCSSDENQAIPIEGQCTSTVCDWACCATDLVVQSDIWARCMATCPQGTSGTGGEPMVAGTGGTTGNAGAPGSTGTGGRGTGTGGSANGGAGLPGANGGGPAPSNGAIPAGYPAPTADNAAKCTTVPMTAGFCPGGGAGPTCLQCLFGGTTYAMNESPPAPADAIAAAGDYVVTVQLGGVGPVSVSAESSRGLLAAGAASQEYAFVVDVRAMEGQPNHAGGPAGYAGLDLYFSGPAGLKVSGIGYALASPATKPVMVYIAGDSTVCDQTGNVFGGWGQMLPQYFGPPVGFANYANSGAASGSFGTYWSMIKAKWTAGDWVMIQFGHNDKNDSDAQVQANLEKMVADAQAANVTPILVSPPARVGSIPISDQSSLHAAAAKAAAASKGCAYIDLTALSTAWYDTLPDVKTALSYHANAGATHTNLAGADKLAQLLANAIKAQNIGLAKYLR